jgi:hypothetical protein
MPRGHPDWQVNTGQFSFLDMDTAEAMVRLGSPNVYSRGGRVFYIDGFEDSLAPWREGTGIATAKISRETGYSFFGSACLKITPAAAVVGEGSANKVFPYVLSGNHSIEFVWWAFTGVEELRAYISFVRDLLGIVYCVKVDFVAKAISIETPGAAFTVIDTFPVNLRSATPTWHWLKLWLDPEASKYVSLSFDEVVYTLSAYGPYSNVSTLSDRITVDLYSIDTAFAASPVYVDNLILAMDEP